MREVSSLSAQFLSHPAAVDASKNGSGVSQDKMLTGKGRQRKRDRQRERFFSQYR